MDQLAKTKRKIQELVAANDFAGVFEALKSILPTEGKAYQNLLLLEARLNEANVNRIRGIVRDEELQVTYASIRNDLLNLVNNLNPVDLDPDQSFSNLDQSGKAKQGQVLYQIPATMRLNQESKCIVRIALNEALLVKNLALIDKTEIKDIRISDLMQVELLDSNKNAPFAIRTNSRKEQFIDKDDYTEWIFFVEPKKEGVYPITIKVAVIEMVHGKEAYREIVLEEQVEIVTTQPATDTEPAFKPAAYNFGFSSQDVQVNYEGSSGGGSNWRRTLAMSLAFLLSFNAITWAVAPAEYEWVATRYLLNSEDAYDNYIERWEEEEKDQHVESAYYHKAEVTQDTNNYEAYLQKYPVNEAGQPLGKYTEEATFKVAELKQSTEAYQKYLDYFEERGKERFQEEATFMVAKLSNSPLAFKKYFDRYSETGQYIAESNRILEEEGQSMLEAAKRDSNLLAIKALQSITPNPEVKKEANAFLEVVPEEIQESLEEELEELTFENERSSHLRSEDSENTLTPELNIKPATPAASITDKDGNTYTTAIMADGRRWITQNLNLEIEGSYCYDNDSKNCLEYGRLYKWEAAKKACASLGGGWRLPNREEWKDLIKDQDETNKFYYDFLKGGTSGFNASLGGTRTSKEKFFNLDRDGTYWGLNSKSGGEIEITHIFLSTLTAKVDIQGSFTHWKDAYSCRCIQKEPSNSDFQSEEENKDDLTPQSDIKPATPAASITDQDGNSYTTAIMADGHRWMTQNLNLKVADSYCYEDDPGNCKEYGRLYTWEAAKKACASLGSGWQVPTKNEWDNLIKLSGGRIAAFKNLMKDGSSGFAALPGGRRSKDGNFLDIDRETHFWSVTKEEKDVIWHYNLSGFANKISDYGVYTQVGLSCRCIQGDSRSDFQSDEKNKLPNEEPKTNQNTSNTPKENELSLDIKPATPAASITDKDGNSYTTAIMADGKRWMTQNLNLKVADSYCYDDDPANCTKYGRLYEWRAAIKACKALGNWHLPTDTEWQNMIKKYGGVDLGSNRDAKVAYQALAKDGPSGFNALLGGGRGSNGEFNSLTEYGGYWSATEYDTSTAWFFYFDSVDARVYRSYGNKLNVRSCRCVQD